MTGFLGLVGVSVVVSTRDRVSHPRRGTSIELQTTANVRCSERAKTPARHFYPFQPRRPVRATSSSRICRSSSSAPRKRQSRQRPYGNERIFPSRRRLLLSRSSAAAAKDATMTARSFIAATALLGAGQVGATRALAWARWNAHTTLTVGLGRLSTAHRTPDVDGATALIRLSLLGRLACTRRNEDSAEICGPRASATHGSQGGKRSGTMHRPISVGREAGQIQWEYPLWTHESSITA